MPAIPHVSVVMSVRNGGRYLQPAIDSIVAQTYPDWEFLIVNDGSTDDTAQQLEAAAKRDARIVPLQRPQRGTIASVNEALSLARGEFIARMDADDICVPERLAKQIAYMERNPGIELLGGHLRYLTESGPTTHVLRFETQPDRIRRRILKCNQFAQPTVLFRRTTIARLGGYHAAYRHCEDYDLWLRFADRYDVANLDEILMDYRLHDHQVSHRFIAQQTISSLAAREASRRRRRGQDDPFAKSELITHESLEELGFARQSVERAILNAYVIWLGVQTRVGMVRSASELRAALPAIAAELGQIRYLQARLLLEDGMQNILCGHAASGCWQALLACGQQPRLLEYAADLLCSRFARYGWRIGLTN